MSTSAVTPPGKIKSRDQIRVLLVDDDPFQLQVISTVLRDIGFADVTQAESGQLALQALTSAKSNPFDLMLSDLHMPGMDGFQFMEEVAKMGFKGNLVIVSGQSEAVLNSASLVARLRRFTLLGSIQKPVNRATLSQVLSGL